MANIKLLKRLRTRFLRMRHEKHFNMAVIAQKTECGSAMCIAGHTLVLAGYKMRLRDAPDRDGISDYVFTPPGSDIRVHALEVAAKELGVPYHDTGYQLFHDWSLETPKDAAERIGELIEEYSQ